MPKKKTNYHEKRRNKQKIVFIILAVVLSVGLIGSSVVWITGGSSLTQPVEEEKQNVTLQDIKSLEASVKSNPDNAVALIELARAYADEGRFKDAFGMYERAVQKNPDDGDLVLELAAMGFLQGEFDKTIRYLENEIKRHPGNENAYYYRGIVLAEGKKDYKKGIQDIENYISMTKDSDEKAKAMQMIDEWKGNLPATG